MTDAIRRGIFAWVSDGRPPGSFLTAVLCNDLKEACARADDHNRYALFDIVFYLYNECPSLCWGSYEKVDAWEKKHAELRAQASTPDSAEPTP